MKKEQQIPLVIALTFGLAGCGGVAIPILDTQTPTTFVPSPTERILPSATATASETFTPSLSPTPEIPFGDKCTLPVNPPFSVGTGYLEQVLDKNTKKPRFDNSGRPMRHNGIDIIGVKEGDNLFNICDSELIFAGFVEGDDGLGNTVVVKDVITGDVLLFAHLSKLTDKLPGDKILAGEKIGEVGQSGGQKKVHLHITVFTPDGWLTVENSTNNFYGGDYSQSLNGEYINLTYVNDEAAVERTEDPVIWIYKATGIQIWKLTST